MTDILIYAGVFLGGAIAALKVISVRTKTKVDDVLLNYGLDAEKVLEALGIDVPDVVVSQRGALIKV